MAEERSVSPSKGDEGGTEVCNIEIGLPAQPPQDAGTATTKTYPLREAVIPLPCTGQVLVFNPCVSLIGLVVLWGFTIYCIVSPEAGTTLSGWMSTMTTHFTWFFVVTSPVLSAFIVWLAYRYGDIKLGDDGADPEFTDAQYFAMIFSAGVGVGLFFYGVSEPFFHQSSHYYASPGYRSQDEIDQWALIITLYHWGFAAWSCYLTVAVAAGLATYRFGLPFTVRSTFYPLIGEYAWGWMGDCVDGFSIVMTVAGVCTSLGLGVMSIVAGMQHLEWVDPNATELTTVYVVTILVITFFATVSVVSGLTRGIVTLSSVAFWGGTLIMFLCFAMEKSSYLMNVLVQVTGGYLQWGVFQMPFWTDAFGGLKEGEGRSVDGKSSATWWIGSWTVFYMAWWVAWACFVGMFIARISKNRSIRTIIVSTFVAPTVYSLLWFSVFGGIGMRQQRQALELEQFGTVHFEDPNYYLAEGSTICYDVPQEDVIVNNTVQFTNTLIGITPVCKFDSNQSTQAWFNVMSSFSYPDNNFGGFGSFMSNLSLLTLVIYFVTSSDSGSMVVDILSANGATEHHWIQRVFWALTEGAVAIALLIAGGTDALSALQSASIVFGLPFNFFLFFMCHSIVTMCQAIETNTNPGDMNTTRMDPKVLLPRKTWNTPIFGGVFNVFEFLFSLGKVNQSRTEKGMALPSRIEFEEFFRALLLPFWSLYDVYCELDPKGTNKLRNLVSTSVYALCFIAWIALFACGTINNGFVAFAWSVFIGNAMILTGVRMKVRERLAIRGNVFSDFCASSILYPQVLSQMVIQFSKESGDNLDGADSIEMVK